MATSPTPMASLLWMRNASNQSQEVKKCRIVLYVPVIFLQQSVILISNDHARFLLYSYKNKHYCSVRSSAALLWIASKCLFIFFYLSPGAKLWFKAINFTHSCVSFASTMDIMVLENWVCFIKYHMKTKELSVYLIYFSNVSLWKWFLSFVCITDGTVPQARHCEQRASIKISRFFL